MFIEEGKRVGMFIERVCKMTQRKFTEEVNKEIIRANPSGKTYTPSEINRMLSGQILLSLTVLKAMHRLWKLNYEWVFEGTGTMQTNRENERKIANDVTEILATVLVLESSINSMKSSIKGLASDYYAFKNGVTNR